MRNKKGMMGGIWSLVGVILAFVVMGIIAAIGMTVTADTKQDLTVDSAGYNATVKSEESVLRVTSKGPTIATAAVFGVIIAILLGIVGYFKVFR